MKTLDEVVSDEKGYFNPKRNKFIILVFSMLSLLLQIGAMYFYIDYAKTMYDSPDLMICFYVPYASRPFVLVLMILSAVFAWKSFNKNGRVFPEENMDKLILGSPLAIWLLDIILSLLIGF